MESILHIHKLALSMNAPMATEMTAMMMITLYHIAPLILMLIKFHVRMRTTSPQGTQFNNPMGDIGWSGHSLAFGVMWTKQCTKDPEWLNTTHYYTNINVVELLYTISLLLGCTRGLDIHCYISLEIPTVVFLLYFLITSTSRLNQ